MKELRRKFFSQEIATVLIDRVPDEAAAHIVETGALSVCMGSVLPSA